MRALDAAQIDRDLALELGVDRLAAEVAHQHIFGRDGGVGLELEHPMAVRLLALEQRARGRARCGPPKRDRSCQSSSACVSRELALSDQIGGAAPGSNGTFDGGGQAGICPIAGQQQIGQTRLRAGPSAHPARAWRQRSRAARARSARAAVSRGRPVAAATSLQMVRASASRGVSMQPVAGADGGRDPAREREHPFGGAVDQPEDRRLVRRRVDAEMRVDDGAEFGRHLETRRPAPRRRRAAPRG